MSRSLCALNGILMAYLISSSGLLHVLGATGGERYVSQSGSDNSTVCQKKAPCRTIEHAVNISNTSDTILVDGSAQSYTINNLTLDKSLLIKPWDNKAPTIECKIQQVPCVIMVDMKNSSELIQMESINMKSCFLCVHQGNFVHSRSQYFAQSTVAVCAGNSETNMTLVNSTLLQSTFMLTNSCIPNIKNLYQGQSVAVSMIGVSFHGISKLVTNGPIAWVKLSLDKVTFANVQSALEISNFDHLQLDVRNMAIENMNSSTTGFTITMGPKDTADISIINSRFHNNTCFKGGVFHIMSKANSGNISVAIANSTFEKNNSTTSGTAVHIDILNSTTGGSPPAQHILNIVNCTFHENINAESAGAVYANGAQINISNCTFRNNKVAAHISMASNSAERKGSGGAVYVLKSTTLTMDNCIFINNSANWFGGAIAGSGNVILTNSYFENSAGGVHSSQGEMWFLMGSVKLANITVNVTYTMSNLAILWYSSDLAVLEGIDDGHIEFSCPVGSQFRNESLPQYAHVSNSYKSLFYFCDACSDKKYSMQHGFFNGSIDINHVNKTNWSEDFACLNCEYGAECHHGKIYSHLNFWGYIHHDHVTMVPCLDGYCCGTDTCEAYNTCAPNRTGTLCGQCGEGMGEVLMGTECKPNEDCTDSWYIIFDVLATIFYLLFFLYQVEIGTFVLKYILWVKVSHKDDASIVAYIKIVFYFYQIVDLLRVQENRATQMVGIAFEPFVAYLFTFQPVAAIFGICPFPGLTPVTKNLLKRSSLVYLMLFLGILAAIYFAYKRWMANDQYESTYVSLNVSPEENVPTYEPPSFKSRLAATFVNFFLFGHVPIATLTFVLLACIPLSGTFVLFIDGNVTCMQSWQAVFFVLAVVHVIPFFASVIVSRHLLDRDKITLPELLLSYILPLPMLLFWFGKWIQAKYRGGQLQIEDADDDPLLSDEQANAREEQELIKEHILLFIEEPYIKESPQEPSAKYWEGVLMLRRLLLVVMDAFIVQELLCMTLQTVACLGFLLWHVEMKPFGARSANHLETVSLTGLTIIGICHIIQAAFISTGHVPEGPTKTQIFVTDWIEWTLLNGFLFVLLLAILVTVFIRLSQFLLWSCKRVVIILRNKGMRQSDPVQRNGVRPGSGFGSNGGLSIRADLVEAAPSSHSSLSN